MTKPLSPVEMMDIIDKATDTYNGDSCILGSALGALCFGTKFGWRALRLSHSASTYSKYEKILGIKFKQVCPERTVLSSRSIALKLADSIGNFWAIAKGEVPGKTLELSVTGNPVI